jgi:hypothetical protein
MYEAQDGAHFLSELDALTVELVAHTGDHAGCYLEPHVPASTVRNGTGVWISYAGLKPSSLLRKASNQAVCFRTSKPYMQASSQAACLITSKQSSLIHIVGVEVMKQAACSHLDETATSGRNQTASN